MNLIIRQENPTDYPITEKIIETAFANVEISDKSEHHLVARLRKSEAFVPELSLVAELNGQLVGHIILTKISIKNESQIFPSRLHFLSFACNYLAE